MSGFEVRIAVKQIREQWDITAGSRYVLASAEQLRGQRI
jgi:hypothetical protein